MPQVPSVTKLLAYAHRAPGRCVSVAGEAPAHEAESSGDRVSSRPGMRMTPASVRRVDGGGCRLGDRLRAFAFAAATRFRPTLPKNTPRWAKHTSMRAMNIQCASAEPRNRRSFFLNGKLQRLAKRVALPRSRAVTTCSSPSTTRAGPSWRARWRGRALSETDSARPAFSRLVSGRGPCRASRAHENHRQWRRAALHQRRQPASR